tara:strand:- start:2499 stop:3530 length:1032 start_codon:yes stop_codon:yes gene_type:complete
MPNDIVIGLQYGDEGKGKIVNHLLKNNNYTFCVKTNGGPNAGHTIYKDKQKIVLHQLPIGAADKDTKCLIGPNCVIDMTKLENEIKMVEEFISFDNDNHIKKRLYLSQNAHVIKPEHIEEDCNTDKIGSTKCGIRPAYRAKYNRSGTRIKDLQLNQEWNVVDSYKVLNPTSNDESILFEISQGFYLDIDFGKYPFVTSSQCHVGSVVSCGFPTNKINKIYGVAKIYTTYVGNMIFQPADPLLEKLQILGNEFGATTSRKRQCNWLNLDELKKAIYICSVTDLIINKCDIINSLNYYKLYHNNDDESELPKEHVFSSWDDMKNYIIENLPKSINITFSYDKDKI